MKYTLLIAAMMFTQSSFAGICETEMAKFSLSTEKQKNICNYFSDSASFNEVKKCIFETARMFKKSTPDEEIYATPEKDLAEIMDSCTAGISKNSKTSTSKEPKKEKPKTPEVTQ